LSQCVVVKRPSCRVDVPNTFERLFIKRALSHFLSHRLCVTRRGSQSCGVSPIWSGRSAVGAAVGAAVEGAVGATVGGAVGAAVDTVEGTVGATVGGAAWRKIELSFNWPGDAFDVS
jgi:hypothetical protein